MSFSLEYKPAQDIPEIVLPSSKSISNRLLIAQALTKGAFEISNLSTATDTVVLQQALKSNFKVVDVGMAGTAFRFLTAFFSLLEGNRILTGVSRMKERPIQILVDELRKMGAEIGYIEREGFPPLQIEGKKLKGGQLSIDATVSSQYISALLLIAPYLEGGLKLKLIGNVVSSPYIDLTIGLQQKIGIEVSRFGNTIEIKEGSYYSDQELNVESDWSSAAFFYQLVTFSGRSIFIKNLNSTSLQGDVQCAQIFQQLGVQTEFRSGGAMLKYQSIIGNQELQLDLTATPDLIPSVAVTASQLVERIIITGTKTLYIKECNRVEALKVELKKIGVVLNELDGNSFEIIGKRITNITDKLSFSTYHDHRMAMCLAPLAVLGNVEVDNKEVVAKSFPNYWKELNKFGISS